MRHSTIVSALLFGILTASAHAMPLSEIPTPSDIHPVQMVCTPQSCIDQRTGVYTQSSCNYRGCWQSSGPVGRLPGYGGGRGYGPPHGPPPYYGPPRYRGGYDPRW